MPVLTQIAHLDDWLPDEEPAHLLPDTLICRIIHQDRVVFIVVDYRTKYATFFSADVDVKRIGFVNVFLRRFEVSF